MYRMRSITLFYIHLAVVFSRDNAVGDAGWMEVELCAQILALGAPRF